jgi:phosphotransferase system HPr (HPr) family protein
LRPTNIFGAPVRRTRPASAARLAVRSHMNPDPIPNCIRAVVVKLENGLHLGPSSQIVQLAQKFTSTLVIRKGDRKVDGKSMLDLLTLAAEHGTVLELETSGADAAEALQAVAGLFERNFSTEEPPGPADKSTPGAV